MTLSKHQKIALAVAALGLAYLWYRNRQSPVTTQATMIASGAGATDPSALPPADIVQAGGTVNTTAPITGNPASVSSSTIDQQGSTSYGAQGLDATHFVTTSDPLNPAQPIGGAVKVNDPANATGIAKLLNNTSIPSANPANKGILTATFPEGFGDQRCAVHNQLMAAKGPQFAWNWTFNTMGMSMFVNQAFGASNEDVKRLISTFCGGGTSVYFGKGYGYAPFTVMYDKATGNVWCARKKGDNGGTSLKSLHINGTGQYTYDKFTQIAPNLARGVNGHV